MTRPRPLGGTLETLGSLEKTSAHDPTATGARAEEAACLWLRARSFAILERNYRIPQGEIDIIARDGAELVFVEVKFLADTRRYFPEEQLTKQKRRRLTRAAAAWLANCPQHAGPCRFDVLAVTPGASGSYEVHHVPAAFEAEENRWPNR